jgi:hypothetical protein
MPPLGENWSRHLSGSGWEAAGRAKKDAALFIDPRSNRDRANVLGNEHTLRRSPTLRDGFNLCWINMSKCQNVYNHAG